MGAGIYLGIMRPSHRLAAAGSTPPPFLGDIMAWAKGDVGVRTAGFYDSLAENGPMGGQFAFEGSKPADTVQFSDLKHVPSFTFGQRFRSTLAASSWNFLHDGSQPYTISGRF